MSGSRLGSLSRFGGGLLGLGSRLGSLTLLGSLGDGVGGGDLGEFERAWLFILENSMDLDVLLLQKSLRTLPKLSNCLFIRGFSFKINKASVMASRFLSFAVAIILVFSINCSLVGFVL